MPQESKKSKSTQSKKEGAQSKPGLDIKPKTGARAKPGLSIKPKKE